MADSGSTQGGRLALAGAAAALLHGACDALASASRVTAPPYLRLEDAPDAFQLLSPVAVSAAASCVSGVIAVIAVSAASGARRRTATVAALVTFFWLLSAVLLWAVWLATPFAAALPGILLGVPRGVLVGAVAARIAGATAAGGERRHDLRDRGA